MKTVRLTIQASKSGFLVVGESDNGTKEVGKAPTADKLEALLQSCLRHCHKRGVNVEIGNSVTGTYVQYPAPRKDLPKDTESK